MINIRETNYNTSTSKFDKLSEFQNDISDNPKKRHDDATRTEIDIGLTH